MMEFPRFIVPQRNNWESMSIITVGIDLAKNVLAVHGVNQARLSWSNRVCRATSCCR